MVKLASVFKEIANGGQLASTTITTMDIALKSMSQAQIAATVSLSGLNAAQIANSLSATNMAESEILAKLATLGFSKEAAIAAVVSDNFSREQAEAAIAAAELTFAEGTATAATNTYKLSLSGAAKALGTFLATNPVGWAIGAAAIIFAVVKAYDALTVSAEEATEQMNESVSAYEEATSKLERLNREFETTEDRINELESRDNLTFVEESELDKLRETNKLLQIQIDLAEKAANAAAKDAADDTITAYHKNFKYEISNDAVQDYISSSSATGNNTALSSDSTNISALLAYIEQMKKLRDEVDTTSEDYIHYQELIDDASDAIWRQVGVLGEYKSNLESIPYDELTQEQKNALEEINNAIELVYRALDPAKWNSMQFDELLDNTAFKKDIDSLKKLASESELTAEQINNIVSQAMKDKMAELGLTAEDVANQFNTMASSADEVGTAVQNQTAPLNGLESAMSEMVSGYDLLKTAQAEMNEGQSLSADTISKLAKACDNYMDYIYEENGLIKLNTEAWQENSEAKMRSDMNAIQNEINELERQNALLEQEKKDYGNRLGEHDVQNRLSEINNEIKANNAVIRENQELYNKYEGIYKSISEAALGWAHTLSEFDNTSSALTNLASVQSEIANGYTITAEKARELAAVYPEILNEATVSADGQITLNKAVADSFIEAKESEIKASVQAEADKLKAKEALLQAELSVVESQIEAAESGDAAKVKSANESASARITLEEAVLAACEQAGIDETTANQLALAAMTGDWDTFKTLATQAVLDLDSESAIAFNNVMSNFAVTSQNMVDNTNQVIGAFNQMGVALQNAMNGIQTDQYQGKTTADQVTGSGKEAVSGLLTDMFEKGKSNYSGSSDGADKESLNEFKNRLQSIVDDYASVEPDLTSLYEQRDRINSQIADVQSQIGLLESLENTSLQKFTSGSSGSGGSSKSGGSGSSAKEQETKNWIDTLNDLDGSVESLSGALGELNEKGSVSTKTLSGLSGAFGKLSSFNNAINAMGKSGATLGEAQEACNALAQELIETSGILDMVNEENAETIASALESMGVTNARTLVMRKFNSASAAAIVAENGLTDAVWEQVEAFLRNSGVTEEEINALRTLRQEQYNAALAAVDFSKANSDVTESLIKQAKAAGAGADKIEALTKIQKLQAMGKSQAEAQGYLEGAATFEEALSTLAERAKIEIGDIKVDVPDVNVNVEVSGNEDNKSANEKYNEDDESRHDLKLYGTFKSYEAAVNRFSEATEKFRQSVEAVEKVEADIAMTEDPMERFAKRFELIDELKKEEETNSEVIRQNTEEIKRLVGVVTNDGIELSYDPEKNELILPPQKDGTSFDDAFKNIDIESIFFNKMLQSPNFDVTKSGFIEIDKNLAALSSLLKEQKNEIDAFNAKFGTNYSIYDFRQKEKFQRIDGSFGMISKAEQSAKEIYNRAVAALEAGNTEEYKRLSEEYEQMAPSIRNIEAIMERFIPVEGSTTSGGAIQNNGKGLWDILEDKSVFSTTIAPAIDESSPQVIDNLKEMMSINETYQESSKKMTEDMKDLNDENIANSKELLETQKQIRQAQKDALNDLAEYVQNSSNALDKIQDVYSTLQQGAKEFSESGGYLTLDTYQKILDLGPQYMSFLVDENGQWVINESRIKAVTAAKAEQLALDNAWAYVERLKLALQKDSIEDLNELLYATTETANGTWDLVYANLAMLDLDGEQFEAALHNIQVMRDLAYGAVQGIGMMTDSASDSINEMRDGLNDIVNYVMEMLKKRTEDEIKAIEDMVDAYNELIDAKKKSLDATKKEESYEKKRSKQLKEIAKLQARIDMLSLDTSREAQAEKKKLMEQMADLQEGLSDTQSDYAIDNHKEALDQMKDAYAKEKDDEIKELEDSISSKQKLWEKAIDYIKSYWGENWDQLKEELLQWNYEVGSDLESNLVTAWDNATVAAQKYGDFVSAMQALENANSAGNSWNTGNLGNSGNNGSSKDVNAIIASKVSEMKQNSNEWNIVNATNSPNKKDKLRELEDDNDRLAGEIGQLLGGKRLTRGTNGVWYLPNGDELYKASTYVSDNGGTGNSNNAVATVNKTAQINQVIMSIVEAMKQNSAEWRRLNALNDPSKKGEMNDLVADNEKKANRISDLYGNAMGGRLRLGTDGVWYLPNGHKLYEETTFVYHKGGVVGDNPTLKQNELFIKAEKGEAVLTEKQQDGIYKLIDKQETMIAKYGALFGVLQSNDILKVQVQEQAKKDMQRSQSIVNNGGDSVSVTVPVQIYPVQKLDDGEIKQLTNKISRNTIQQINDGFTRRGHNNHSATLLKP